MDLTSDEQLRAKLAAYILKPHVTPLMVLGATISYLQKGVNPTNVELANLLDKTINEFRKVKIDAAIVQAKQE